MSQLVFEIFNGWHVGTLCLILGFIHFLRFVPDWKRHPARLKGCAFFAFAISFYMIQAGAVPNPQDQRAILRLLFALFLFNEIGYHAVDILLLLERGRDWIEDVRRSN